MPKDGRRLGFFNLTPQAELGWYQLDIVLNNEIILGQSFEVKTLNNNQIIL